MSATYLICVQESQGSEIKNCKKSHPVKPSGSMIIVQFLFPLTLLFSCDKKTGGTKGKFVARV